MNSRVGDQLPVYLHLQLVHLGLNFFGIHEVNNLISTQACVGKCRAHSHSMTLVTCSCLQLAAVTHTRAKPR